MPDIIITNNSGHNQAFEVHGWNHDLTITVKPHSTSRIHAADKSSGAIIALHDGHEGEQAEITFDGYKGNDFIDISNIVGAGGNITIQQEGDNTTRKGDPLFMQNFRQAWHKASPETKGHLRSSVFLDGHGQVARIGPIKDSPELEKFVRKFADGKTYIGVGAWGGSPGNPTDNNQSAAAHGTKNAVITYSDEDATPSQPAHLAHRVGVAKLVVQARVASPSAGDHANEQKKSHDSGPGISLSNRSSKEQAYFFYDNYWNGNGTAGANFDHPLRSVHLAPHATSFVALPATFKGRVQRGTRIPATWAEFQLNASNDHAAHGDISLEQGCDGAAMIHATDGSGRSNGFSHDILAKAPRAAITKRADGIEVLASTMGNWMAGPNEAAAEYELKAVGQAKAYIKGGTGTEDVASKNQQLAIEFF